MGFGAIYALSWFGNTNEANSWGIIYPFDADGSFLKVDTNKIKADTTQYKADATQF